ncbi:hypothetical protein HDU67_002420 [Dinochytrium kinnereticum]|nr:hypothetical protein HDU67_002420 [Dinochytrium kinnereticum]
MASHPSHPIHPKSSYTLLTLANAREYFPEWKVLVTGRMDSTSLPTKYWSPKVLKISDQLVKSIPKPDIPTEVKDSLGAVRNQSELDTATEKVRQWNEVESIITNVLSEHMDATMRRKFLSAKSYPSVHLRFSEFEVMLQHDPSQTIEILRAELRPALDTALQLAEEFDERVNKLIALGDTTVTDESYYNDFLLALTPMASETIGLTNTFNHNKYTKISEVITYLQRQQARNAQVKE